MISLVVRVTVKQGQDDQFIAAFRALAAKVRETETGLGDYRLVKVRDSEDAYMFVESYASDEVLANHGSNPATQDLVATLGSFLDGAPELVFGDLVVDGLDAAG